MPIVQISRIQHRRGKATDLPQLAAGELGWSIDDQKLYIGNGTLADGAPNIGNTEIVTAGSSSFTTALTHVYKGYLGDATTINTGNTTRTLQSVLDDYVSVKSFGAVGDGSTADVTAIQRAIDELYTDPDKTDARSRRILFFPAGTYNINTSITIPPYAHLRGEGPDKTIIYQSGGSNPENKIVAKTKDGGAPSPLTPTGHTWPNIGSGSSTLPTMIQIEGITFKNGEAYAGLSLDDATNVYVKNCKFQGTYAARGADLSTSKAVTVRSSNSTTQSCSKIVFDQCIFTKFSRLVDFSYDVTDVKFLNCDFNTSYYGALLGAEMDGSTAGLTNGPRHIIFNGGNWSTIGQQAIYVKPIAGANAGVGPRDIISHSNFYSHSVANNFEGYGSIREVPVIQYDNDECSSTLDFFERTDLRRSDGSSELNAAPEIQGIGIQTKVIKSQTLPDNTSTATVLNEFPALAGKGFMIKYKIVRGTLERTGEFKISGSTSSPLVSGSYTPAYDDDYRESNGDVGVELTADIVDKDSTSGTETLRIKFTTTNTSGSPGAATIDYQTTILA